jgi:hypothetical protein
MTCLPARNLILVEGEVASAQRAILSLTLINDGNVRHDVLLGFAPEGPQSVLHLAHLGSPQQRLHSHHVPLFRGVAAFLHQEIKLGRPDCADDGRLFGLIIEIARTAWRRRHENQAQAKLIWPRRASAPPSRPTGLKPSATSAAANSWCFASSSHGTRSNASSASDGQRAPQTISKPPAAVPDRSPSDRGLRHPGRRRDHDRATEGQKGQPTHRSSARRPPICQTVFGRSSLPLPQLLPLADFGLVSIR